MLSIGQGSGIVLSFDVGCASLSVELGCFLNAPVGIGAVAARLCLVDDSDGLRWTRSAPGHLLVQRILWTHLCQLLHLVCHTVLCCYP